ncbi:MFS transporter [Piscibacillus salipiscarius]|nr:MFS transporter [Piscibacillus salipiscarius]
MKKAKDPFIPPHLFKNSNYVVTLLVSFISVACLFGLMFSVPIMLRDVYELSTLQIGLAMFPGAMSAALIGRKGGQLVDQKGSRMIFLVSLLLLLTGFLVVSTTVGTHPVIFSLSLVFPMMCFPLVQSSGADLLAGILSQKETGVGMGVFNLLNFVSGALSGALVGKVLDIYRPDYPLNPLGVIDSGAVYSNVFIVFMVLILVGFIVFKFFHHSPLQTKTESP